MPSWREIRRIGLVVAIGVLAVESARAEIQVSSDHFTVHWDAASGSVAGYSVFVARNGGPFPDEPSARIYDPEVRTATVSGSYGDTVRVRIRAINPAGLSGPASEASDRVKFSWPLADDWRSIASGDFDGDGAGDFLWQGSGAAGDSSQTGGSARPMLLSHYDLKQGDPSLRFQSVVSLEGLGWTPLMAADLDGDGEDELLWRGDEQPGFWLLLVSSPGSNRPAQLISVVDSTSWLAGVGDLDGDGRDDLIVRNGDGVVDAWLMNGAAIRSAGEVARVGLEWAIEGVGDLDGDGRVDLVWRHTDGTVFAWLMDGLSYHAAGHVAAVDREWTLLETLDLNGDGHSDLVWAHSDGRVHGWLMQGTTMSEHGHLGYGGVPWSYVGHSDLDGDGRGDLLWRHETGAVMLWRMDGVHIANAAWIGPPPPN